MDITWLGADTLLLKGRDTKVLIDPSGSDAAAAARAGADVLVGGVGPQNVLRPDSGPQVVARPGEYELRGVSVRGVAVRDGTAFVTEVDEVAVCSFGLLPADISEEALEALGVIDVLAVSLESGAPARAVAVAQLVSRLQPAVMVPTGYEPAAELAAGELAGFVKEMGLAQVSSQAKLTLTGSAGGTEDTRVVILEPRS
ncbi:MAG: MBL fold metallo-hydrolase [Candidatus Dormibacteria bacterium]